ncbi:hypothetical protein BTA51_27135 [Hahella sp. CCB-MM4]|uniref:DUF3592 domain-containing protein n=1 Tax=Hahella sp. (strain CCB-MM4) TaxID=1926491 RepID=UPI000B9BA16A|nr:DUF3592 domain-containing protein [Hahella sp. CCB-MM4]OZG70271.1 hypothetical protein BTA51_27135 [Hahella sp. CCB-MM4]
MNLDAIEKVLVWLLIFGVLIYEIWFYLRGRSSLKWKQHPAKVVSVYVNVRDNDGTEESSPSIKYEYFFNGSLYTGKRYAYGDIWSRNYGDSTRKISSIHVGRSIDIYVNPKHPNQSVVRKGYTGNILLEIVFLGIALVGIAVS